MEMIEGKKMPVRTRRINASRPRPMNGGWRYQRDPDRLGNPMEQTDIPASCK
ncbi:hypothetical protein [Sphingobium aquiterrae]|uniref:hypothetical protein n=1 Tax=Sphingobium aquiterrae TaxID=2038656 RepID=UPI003016DF3E